MCKKPKQKKNLKFKVVIYRIQDSDSNSTESQFQNETRIWIRPNPKFQNKTQILPNPNFKIRFGRPL